MKSHELARILLAQPNLPVATVAHGCVYMSKTDRHTHGPLDIGILHSYGGTHIAFGDIHKRDLNYPNWYITKMVKGEAPWDHAGNPQPQDA